MAKKEHDESKLPAWAQQELAGLRRKLKDLAEHLDIANGHHGVTNTISDPYAVQHGRPKPLYLPKYEIVRFMGDDGFYVDVGVEERSGRVKVRAENSVVVELEASNTFTLHDSRLVEGVK